MKDVNGQMEDELRSWKQLSIVVNPEGLSPFVMEQIIYKGLTMVLKYRHFILEYVGHIVILRSTTAEYYLL